MTYIQSAGIVPVKLTKKRHKFLMLRRGTYWDCPKGKLDDGETHLQAALRETAEETCLTDIDFPWGLEFAETDPYSAKDKQSKKGMKVARYYLGRVLSGEPKLVPNPESGVIEHNEFRWLTYKQAKKLDLNKRIIKILDWAEENIYPRVQDGQE